MQLGDARKVSPIDPEGKWFNDYLADRAEEFWRGEMGRPKLARGAPSDPELVRPNWRSVPFHALTTAEKALFNDSVDRMRAAGRMAIGDIQRVPKVHDSAPSRPASEIPAPPLRDENDDEVRRILEQMDAA